MPTGTALRLLSDGGHARNRLAVAIEVDADGEWGTYSWVIQGKRHQARVRPR
jgi:hypothetical protein